MTQWISRPNAKALVRAEDNDPYSVAHAPSVGPQTLHDADWLDERANGDSELTPDDRDRLRTAASVLRLLADQLQRRRSDLVCVTHGPMSVESPWVCGECAAQQLRTIAARASGSSDRE